MSVIHLCNIFRVILVARVSPLKVMFETIGCPAYELHASREHQRKFQFGRVQILAH